MKTVDPSAPPVEHAKKPEPVGIGTEPMAADAELLGWLTGSLDPGEMSRLSGELAASPALTARLAEMRARIQEPVEDDDLEFLVPPSGRSAGRLPLQGRVERSVGFAGATLQGSAESACVRVLLTPPDRLDRRVVLLERSGGRWRVLMPADPDEELRLADLPSEGDAHVLEVVPEGDATRYAVALPVHGQADPRWDRPEDERWAALRGAVNRAEVPLFSLDLGLVGG